MKIGLIGLGNMATAMIGGMIGTGTVKAEDVIVSSRTKQSVEKIVSRFGVCPRNTNLDVAKESDILILAVKPQMYEAVLKEIAGALRPETVVVSIAPGKTMQWISDRLSAETKIVRCMPNTPALVSEGCTGVCKNALVTEAEMERVLSILNSFGKAFVVPETLMDTVVGVSGSSPAYVFMFIEAMADAAVSDGMPRNQAYEFAAQAVYGSAKMVLETGMHPAQLKDMVCSPGGTTIEAVRVLEEKGFRSAVMEAQKACVEKAKNV